MPGSPNRAKAEGGVCTTPTRSPITLRPRSPRFASTPSPTILVSNLKIESDGREGGRRLRPLSGGASTAPLPGPQKSRGTHASSSLPVEDDGANDGSRHLAAHAPPKRKRSIAGGEVPARGECAGSPTRVPRTAMHGGGGIPDLREDADNDGQLEMLREQQEMQNQEISILLSFSRSRAAEEARMAEEQLTMIGEEQRMASEQAAVLVMVNKARLVLAPSRDLPCRPQQHAHAAATPPTGSSEDGSAHMSQDQTNSNKPLSSMTACQRSGPTADRGQGASARGGSDGAPLVRMGAMARALFRSNAVVDEDSVMEGR